MQPTTRHLILTAFLLTLSYAPAATAPDNTGSFNVRESEPLNPELLLIKTEHELTLTPNHPALLTQRAACLALLDRHEEAADAFRHASLTAPVVKQDRISLFVWATSLYEIKTYCRAQHVLDLLAVSYPHSHFAERGRRLSLKIEKILSKHATPKNLNWYLNQGAQAYRNAHPALAIDYLEECVLLSEHGHLSIPAPDLLHFSLGGAYLECGDISQAIIHLKCVPPKYAQYRAGLMLALALKTINPGDDTARELLVLTAREATRVNVRERAQQLLDEVDLEGMATP
jgi:tetratricopeptide (TPR) repeat protein